MIQKGKSGLKLTPRNRARNPKSSAQTGVRNNMSKSSKLFASMTTAQVAAWNQYGASLTKHNSISGTTYTSSGINAFNALATKYLQVNPNGPNGGITKTELLLQPLKGKNRTPNAKGYRSKGFFQFAVGSLSTTVSVPTGYYAAAYRFVNQTNGQELAIVPIAVVTVALAVEDGGAAEEPVAKKKAA